jgi:ABC-type uncharacterized transport system auxiliary subunit
MKKFVACCLITSVMAALAGCGNDSTQNTNSAPIVTKEGADKKGHKTKSFEASFEDPPKK